jgi:hypothetical protein
MTFMQSQLLLKYRGPPQFLTGTYCLGLGPLHSLLLLRYPIPL